MKRSCSLLGGFSRDFREFKPLGQCSPNRGRVGKFLPKQESLLPGQSTGLTPHERTCPWVSVPPAYARSTWCGTVAGTPSRAQVPSSSLGTLPFAGAGDLLGSVVHGTTRGLLGGRTSVQLHGQDRRDPVNLAKYLKDCVRCPNEGFWWGDLRCASPALHLGRKTASSAYDKSHLLGASPLLFHL